ncbi:MAG: 50S ribosomal protein L2, partial [Candidatus Aenigmatarchaeota archaeon]
MGKLIISRRRGKGHSTYRAKGSLEVKLPKKEGVARISDISHVSARNTPIMSVTFGDGTTEKLIAPENVSTNDSLEFSAVAGIKPGNVLPLSSIPEGTPVFCIEKSFGDGGKLCKSSGSFAVVKSREKKVVYLQLPSKSLKKFAANCRAVVGKPAGYGRNAKPFMKAGLKLRHMRSRGKLWPITSGSKMNPIDHPFGGKTGPGQSTT